MRRLALIPVAAILLAGCSSNRDNSIPGGSIPDNLFIGTWKTAGSANAPTAPDMKQFASMNTLQVKPDKSFVLNLMGAEMKGTYTVADKTGTFNVSSIGGKDSPPGGALVNIGTLSADGKKLTLSGPAGMGPPLEFTKAGS
jgi:hypothetical protein